MADLRFLVVAMSKPTELDVRVAGRCLDGPIYIGDRFTEVEGPAGKTIVDLSVVEISSYGRLMSQLDPVVTGELTLSGSMPRGLVERTVLIGIGSDRIDRLGGG